MDINTSVEKFIKYRFDEISLADEKATRIVAMSAGGGVFTVLAAQLSVASQSYFLLKLMVVVPLAFFGIATLFALSTIFPRRRSKPSSTVWSDVFIAQQCKSDADVDVFKKLISDANEADESAKLAIQLANITNAKFDELRSSVRFFNIAIVLALVYIALAVVIP